MLRSRISIAMCSLLLLSPSFPVKPTENPGPQRAYRESVVWQIIFVRTRPGMFDRYLGALNQRFRLELDEAIRQGLLVDYKIITKWPADPDDWDVMIMEAYPDMAALDDFQAKWDAVDRKVFKSLGQRDEALINMNELRDTIGRIITREIQFAGETE
ncbi:MAG: hypothetical protein JSU77_11475 [Fidelibacterota bacterium]|nr:MAG: hypothetical protein JSU77_11475 [Candidatus Neomarinimicrobiota bacterium]